MKHQPALITLIGSCKHRVRLSYVIASNNEVNIGVEEACWMSSRHLRAQFSAPHTLISNYLLGEVTVEEICAQWEFYGVCDRDATIIYVFLIRVVLLN